jgi:hypothetical protein
MKKIFGIIILLFALLGVITTINKYQSRVLWNQQLIEQQSNSNPEKWRAERIVEIEAKLNADAQLLLYIGLIYNVLFAIPGAYLLGTGKRNLIAIDWVLLISAIINFLSIILIKGTGDSLFPPYMLIAIPVSTVYIISFIIMLFSAKRRVILENIKE